MQRDILVFPVDRSMAVDEKRFNQLKARVDALEQSAPSPTSPAPASHGFSWAVVGPVVGSAVAIIAVTVSFGIHLDSKIGDVQHNYEALSQRADKMESAIKALNSQQSEQTQKLIQSLLAAAKTNPSPEFAARAASTVASVTHNLRENKVPASPEFFESAFTDLKATLPHAGPSAFAAEVALAEYRSSLITMQVPSSAFSCMGEAAKLPSHLGGRVTNLTFYGCAYSLDGAAYTNVVFINSHIIYGGGPVQLNDVVFVNCTFEAQPSPKGSQLLEYAALDQQQLSIGS